MSKNYPISHAIWRGNSTSKKDVCLLVSIGGNFKTGDLLELSLVPTLLLTMWNDLTKGKDKSSHGSIYVQALKRLGLIRSVCTDDCGYIDGGCYAQHNVRTAGQAARIIRNLKEIPTMDTFDSANLSKLVMIAFNFFGVRHMRSMVVGDACMIPKKIWNELNGVLALNTGFEWLAYTHGWRTADHLRSTHVASCDNTTEAMEALALGWRVYSVLAPIGEAIPSGAALCPASREFKLANNGLAMSCAGCPMKCNGDSSKDWRVIPRHSNGDAARKIAAGKRGEVLVDSKGRTKGLYL